MSPIDACCATCSTREEDDPDEVDDLVFEDCVDSADWYMDEKPSKDCTWIGKKIENRCDDEYIGVDGKSSKESCPVTCELCEEDESNDATWDDKETWDDKNYEEEEEWKTWDDQSTTWDDQSTTWDDKSDCVDSASWYYKKTKFTCEKLQEKYDTMFCTASPILAHGAYVASTRAYGAYGAYVDSL